MKVPEYFPTFSFYSFPRVLSAARAKRLYSIYVARRTVSTHTVLPVSPTRELLYRAFLQAHTCSVSGIDESTLAEIRRGWRAGLVGDPGCHFFAVIGAVRGGVISTIQGYTKQILFAKLVTRFLRAIKSCLRRTDHGENTVAQFGQGQRIRNGQSRRRVNYYPVENGADRLQKRF